MAQNIGLWTVEKTPLAIVLFWYIWTSKNKIETPWAF
jgi:hypothetical protein